MAKVLEKDSGRMYSWWWNSHISPKNSKWLQENLTDMDTNVKVMIKLIEEDADSFARRAEMYYKKRPELMKMVEEFYRAYRALAERYDHATGVIRQAHHTMAEHFPNQVPTFADDSPFSGTEPRTPDGEFTDEYDSVRKRRTSKISNDSFGVVERAKRGLNFDEAEEKEQSTESNGKSSKSDLGSESEEIRVLKEAIAKLEAEKEAGLAHYQQSLDKLAQLESEISKTQDDFKVLTDHASKAEKEVLVLKEALTKSEAEKEAKLHDYQQSLDRISDLQNIVSTLQEDANKLDERSSSAETEVESLKAELKKLVLEKDEALNQYVGSLGTISKLESKLRLAEEGSRTLQERAENAESEIENLKLIVSKLTEEKEALAMQYQNCLETISILEKKLRSAEEEAKRLHVEIDNGATKLKGAEEQCHMLEKSNQSLHSELESLMLKMGTQNQELTEKQKELGRLWACVQEERIRFVEAETAFQTLQHLHAKTQEELRSMASELQKRAQILKVLETNNQNLQDEVVKVKGENKHLDELNASSVLSINDMQNEISGLRDSKGKLEEEVELRVDQRNALQQEIYCLKEELNNLKETCHKESSEKATLLEKLVILEQLLEKNSILETSLADLNAELEAVRGKMETLEQSFQSLLEEKSTLVTEKATLVLQLEETSKNVERLSENNTVLQNSLSDAQNQLETLSAKSKLLEDSCQLLVNEKASLISEKDGLNSELVNTKIKLEGLEKIYGELEGRCFTLEKEKESTLRKVEQLQISLDGERQGHGNYIQMREAEVNLLQEECRCRKRELDQVIDDAVHNDIEMFVLRRASQELTENHLSALVSNQKLLHESILSKEKICQLEKSNFEQEVEIKSLCEQATGLRVGTSQLLNVLGIFEKHVGKDTPDQDKVNFVQLLDKLQSMKEQLCEVEEEHQQQTVELSVLIEWVRQLTLDSKNLEVEKCDIEHELKARTEQILALQSEVLAALDLNEELKSKLKEEDCNKEALANQIDDLNKKLKNMQSTCQVLETEKLEITEQKRSLMDKLKRSDEKNNVLEEENYFLRGEVLALDNMSLIFRSFSNERCMELSDLGDSFNKLQDINAAFVQKLSLTEAKLQESKTENHNLEGRLQKSKGELMDIVTAKSQLTDEIENRKQVLHQMELELQDAEQKINLVETEKMELTKNLDDLRENNDHLLKENNCLLGTSQVLKSELHELHGENNKRKIQEQNLQHELETRTNEINKLEEEAASLYGQFHYSIVGHLLYEQKFNELHEAFISCVDETEELKTQLAAYGPEIVALKECVSSLENHTNIHTKFQNPENEEMQGSEVMNSHENVPNGDKKMPKPPTFSDLIDLPTRLQAVEMGAIEIKEMMVQENMDLHSKLDASTKQLELVQSESGRYRRNWKPSSEITEAESTTLTKDIMLDQVSDGSSYGFSKREPIEPDNDQILEYWETADRDGSIGLTVGKSKRLVSPSIDTPDFRRVKSVKKLKEIGVDKLDISKRFTEPLPEGNKRKVLERLDSDVQKLANLQITVQDLKRKLMVTEKDKRGKAVIQCEALKRQLDEADVAILKLFDLNGKLVRNVEDGSSFSEAKSSFDLEGEEGAKRRRVSEQARRMSEKIGRLQLEVQKLQFVLLKIDGENDGKAKMAEIKRRVLLRDYLYGGGKKGQRRKKTQFCACVQPSTVED